MLTAFNFLPSWRVRLGRDEKIYSEGEPADIVYRLAEGCVRLQVVAPSGGRQVTHFLDKDEVFGFGFGVHRATAEAATAVELQCVSMRAVLAAARQDPKLLQGFLDVADRRFGDLAHHLEMIAHKPVEDRVLAFLWSFAGSPRRQSRDVCLPMSQRDVSDYLAVSPETLSRSLRTLEDRGIISRHGQRRLRLGDSARQRFSEFAA